MYGLLQIYQMQLNSVDRVFIFSKKEKKRKKVRTKCRLQKPASEKQFHEGIHFHCLRENIILI